MRASLSEPVPVTPAPRREAQDAACVRNTTHPDTAGWILDPSRRFRSSLTRDVAPELVDLRCGPTARPLVIDVPLRTGAGSGCPWLEY